ncbi:hypothetical protein M404DRAFT_30365 [Pisolithus tinctorius Marx 270]|uniref:Uncharacterized protein n=1 Tax=Pisolithus tinctorius Marx 270 TaxID=870435 RepID=A0A0C3NEH0_PISTI|nr:hypothetical protein M404DRAFT_30365 [Pisolithus tinctorius Marx 270]
MRDQAITSLSAALRYIRVLINTAPWPKESFEVIYKWVEDWDQTWYINENKISIPKVRNANLCDMTKESVIQQNKVIPVAIAIVDLWQPEGQHRFNIDNLFEDYQEWATSKEDELVDDVDDDEGDGEGKPGPFVKGPCRAGENEPCKTRAQANLAPAKKLTLKILAEKQQPDPTPTRSPSPEPTPSPHDPSPAPHLFFRRATPTPGPSFKPSPVPVNDPQMSLPIDEPQGEIKPFFATATSLLDEPGDVEVTAQSDIPSVSEILEVKYPHMQSTVNIVKHLRVLEARAKDEEFELEQVYQMLEMLARWVTHQIETVQARWEELQRLKDNLQDL